MILFYKNLFFFQVACDDGFLYIYSFTNEGECKLLKCHDLRGSLFDITELTDESNGAASENSSTVESPEIEEKSFPNSVNFETSFAEVIRGKSAANAISSENKNSNVQKLDEKCFPAMCQA